MNTIFPGILTSTPHCLAAVMLSSCANLPVSPDNIE